MLESIAKDIVEDRGLTHLLTPWPILSEFVLHIINYQGKFPTISSVVFDDPQMTSMVLGPVIQSISGMDYLEGCCE